MAGRPGQVPWNKQTLAEHERQGTLRPARHLPKLEPTPQAAPWAPSESDVQGLQAAGQRFLAQMLERFDCSMVEGTLVVAAAYTVDTLTTWRLLAHTDPGAARLTLQHTKVLAALLAQLRVRA